MDNKSTSSQDVLNLVTRTHERIMGEALIELHANVLIRLNHGLMMDFLGRHLAPFELSPVSFFTMMRLYSNANNLANPSELSTFTGETRTNMTRICDDLAKRGLMHRVSSEEDRRRIDLSLTEKGIQLLHNVLPVLRAQAAVVYSVFDEDEKKALVAMLTKLNQALEANL